MFAASYGQIWMKIGGNQAVTFPDLPIQLRNLDSNRKTGKIANTISREFADIFYPNIYSDIRLYQFLDTNIFGYSFIALSIENLIVVNLMFSGFFYHNGKMKFFLDIFLSLE